MFFKPNKALLLASEKN